MIVIESIIPVTLKHGDIFRTVCVVRDTNGHEHKGESNCHKDNFNALDEESKAFAAAIGVPGARIPDSHYEHHETQVVTIRTRMGKEHKGVDRAYSKELEAALRAAADWIAAGNEGDYVAAGNSSVHFHTA